MVDPRTRAGVPDDRATLEVLSLQAAPAVFVAHREAETAWRAAQGIHPVAQDVATDVVCATYAVAEDEDVPAIGSSGEVLGPAGSPAVTIVVRIAVVVYSSATVLCNQLAPGVTDNGVDGTAAARLHECGVAVLAATEVLNAAIAPAVDNAFGVADGCTAPDAIECILV